MATPQTIQGTWREIAELDSAAAAASQQFLNAHGAQVQEFQQRLSEAIQDASQSLRDDVAEISGQNETCVRLVEQAADYVDWLQWSLWDLPYFAVPIGMDAEQFGKRAASCAFVYLAGRVFDDVLDRHFWYKAKKPTIFAAVAETHSSSEGAESLTILSGLLLCSEGLRRLAASDDPEQREMLRKVLDSFRRAVVGAVLEHADRDAWNADYYERLIWLKNVDFWRCLYTAVDPRRESPLYPFLQRYYAFAQKLNDVQDFAEDERRGQPNLLSIRRRQGLVSPGLDPGRVAPIEVEQELADGLLSLQTIAESLPATERSVALLKLGEMLRESFRLGLFQGAAPAPSPNQPADTVQTPLNLQWYSTLADVVDQAGAASLEEAICAVCGGSGRQRLFEVRGFSYYRCAGCSHIHINPRLKVGWQLQLGEELEHLDEENDFLEVQKIFAEPICHLLRLRAPGPRLLDLGFGRGHVMRLAQAYGFQVYGIDSSARLVRDLEPEFGKRLHHARLGVDPIPWTSFDAIVISHVLEHLPDPAEVMRDVLSRLTAGGVLYIAVPDMDSLQFRLFGKNWDVVSPLVHYQYFTEASLKKLLEHCGFERLERIEYPALPRELTPKWMQLFRKLGGDESGELAMIAERPRGFGTAGSGPPKS